MYRIADAIFNKVKQQPSWLVFLCGLRSWSVFSQCLKFDSTCRFEWINLASFFQQKIYLIDMHYQCTIILHTLNDMLIRQ
jgi:hypothetical protein